MLRRAQRFAALLDRNEFAAAGEFLLPDCRYLFRGQEITGREAILKSYRDNYESGKSILDEILFSSEVIAVGAAKAKICYLDKIRKGSEWLEHRCEQDLDFTGELISLVTHVDLPGEAERLKEFYAKAGIVRE